MGIELIKAAVARHGSLPAQPYKVLIRMCLSAHDKSAPDRPEHLYQGGWEPLAIALGYDPTDKNKSQWMRKQVHRACRQLTDLGIIKPLVDNPGFGTRQVWKIQP